MSHLFCFGFGFSAAALARLLAPEGWTISGTSRSAEGAGAISAQGYRGIQFDGTAPLLARALDGVTHVLLSAPPDADGDPVFRTCLAQLQLAAPRWVGYLSTTGVYGDRGGEWVTEEDALEPSTERGARRLAAESAWLRSGLPVHIFRLAGIYGPGRNQLETVRDGTARCIIKPGQVFSRIHVDDIATTLSASIAHPQPGCAYNVCDDFPCPPQDVVRYAADLLKVSAPPDIPFEQAQLSPMARSFYAESKKVSNHRIKQELGVALAFPSYREGLAALLPQLK